MQTKRALVNYLSPYSFIERVSKSHGPWTCAGINSSCYLTVCFFSYHYLSLWDTPQIILNVSVVIILYTLAGVAIFVWIYTQPRKHPTRYIKCYRCNWSVVCHVPGWWIYRHHQQYPVWSFPDIPWHQSSQYISVAREPSPPPVCMQAGQFNWRLKKPTIQFKLLRLGSRGRDPACPEAACTEKAVDLG